MSCRKAQGFLAANGWQIGGPVVNATRQRKGRAKALELARSVRRVVVGWGRKVVILDMQKDPPDDDTLAAQLLGPSGNLKAPTLPGCQEHLPTNQPSCVMEMEGETNDRPASASLNARSRSDASRHLTT